MMVMALEREVFFRQAHDGASFLIPCLAVTFARAKKTMVPKIDAARKRITSSQTLVPKNET